MKESNISAINFFMEIRERLKITCHHTKSSKGYDEDCRSQDGPIFRNVYTFGNRNTSWTSDFSSLALSHDKLSVQAFTSHPSELHAPSVTAKLQHTWSIRPLASMLCHPLKVKHTYASRQISPPNASSQQFQIVHPNSSVGHRET